MRFSKILFLCLGMILVGTSCTRKINSTMNISISGKSFRNQKVSAMSACGGPGLSCTKFPQNVILNLQSKGVTLAREWQCDRDLDPSQCASQLASETFTFNNVEVEAGTTVQLQVLLIEDNGFDPIDLKHIGKNVSIEAKNNQVEISVSQMQSVGTVTAEGVIKGRVIDRTGNDGTGRLVGYAQLNPNFPAMKITSSVMVAGWFSVFFVEGIDFTYKLVGALDENNVREILFDQKNLGDFSGFGAAQSARLFQLQQHYELKDENDDAYLSDSEAEFQKAQRLGFAFMNINNTLDNFSTYGIHFDATASIGGGGDRRFVTCDTYDGDEPLSAGSVTGECDTDYSFSLNNNSGVVSLGVVGDYAYVENGNTGSSCTEPDGSLSSSCIEVNSEKLNRPWSIGFKGAYQELESSGHLADIDANASELTVNFNYVPGAAAVLAGTSVFFVHKNYEKDLRTNIGNGIRCAGLAAGLIPSEYSKSASSAEESILIASSSVPNVWSDPNSYRIAVCPYASVLSQRVYLNQGAFDFQIKGGSGGDSATKLGAELILLGGDQTGVINTDVCIAMEIYTADDSGGIRSPASATDIVLESSNANIDFFTDHECSSAYTLATDFKAVNDHFHKVVSFKTSVTTSTAFSITVRAENGESLTSQSLNFSDVNANVADKLSVVAFGRGFSDYNCVPLRIYGTHSGTNSPAKFASGTSGAIQVDSASNLTAFNYPGYFYGLDVCDTSNLYSSSTLAVGASAHYAAVKPSNPTTNSGSIGFGDSNGGAFAVNVDSQLSEAWTDPGSISHTDIVSKLSAAGLSKYQTGLCLPLDFIFYDNETNIAPGDGSDMTINFPANVRVFNSIDCNSGEIASGDILNRGSSEQLNVSMIIKSPASFGISLGGGENHQALSVDIAQIDQTQLSYTDPNPPSNGSCTALYFYLEDSSSGSFASYFGSPYGGYVLDFTVQSRTTGTVGVFWQSGGGCVSTNLSAGDTLSSIGSGVYTIDFAPGASVGTSNVVLDPVDGIFYPNIFNVTTY